MSIVPEACACPRAPLNLQMPSDSRVSLPRWLPHGLCCNPGCRQTTWNTRGPKVYDSPQETLSRDHATRAQGYPKATVCSKGRKEKGSLGKTDFEGDTPSHNKTNAQILSLGLTRYQNQWLLGTEIICQALLPIWSSWDLPYNSLCLRSPGYVGPEAILQQALTTIQL